MDTSQEPVGRVNYALRVLLATAMALAIEIVGNALLHLDRLPHYAYSTQWLVVMSLFAPTLLPVLNGRLLDSCSPRWIKYPALFVWILSTSIHAIWPPEWLIGMGLFALLLATGLLLPPKRAVVALGSKCDTRQLSHPFSPAPVIHHHSDFPLQLLIGQVDFIRALLSLACLWIPLIWLANSSGWPAGVWIARVGYSVLAIVWFFKFIGRLADAGKLPRARYGYLAIGGILLIGLISRLQWREAPPTYSASITAGWLKHINGDEILALFLAAQIPAAFYRSKSRRTGASSQNRTKATKTNELALSGPSEYLRILLVLSCVFIPLIYMDNASGGNMRSWIARAGYLIVGCAWLIFADGRLEDAGWGHSSYPSQYFLLVCTLSLMPLAYHWVNGYGALAIFFLIQIPTVLLPSKPTELDPVSADSAAE